MIEVSKSDLQIKLDKNGCIFHGQEMLSKHEQNPRKPCFCGRKAKTEQQLDLFCYWADFYGLVILPGFKHDSFSRDWAK